MEKPAPRLLFRLPLAPPARGLFWLALLIPALLIALRTNQPPLRLRAQESGARLYISEVHPNPQAAPDSRGEWLELFNPGPAAVNLAGWQLRAGSGYSATVAVDAVIEANNYAVLAESAAAAENGGVSALAVLPGLLLADVDTLALYTLGGERVESAAWGENPAVQPGRSLERTGWGEPAAWAAAWQPWPGSAGDWGSPGAAYSPAPTPTPPPPLLITELLPDPAAAPDDTGEWVELLNPNAAAVALDGWRLENGAGDAQPLDGLGVEAEAYVVLGRSADAASNGGVAVQGALKLALANGAGSLSLYAPGGALVDWVAWGGDPPALPVLPGRSLERAASEQGGALAWRAAVGPWPGSAGDWGSPGAPPPPAPPTPTPAPAAPSPTPLPAAWPTPAPDAPAAPLQIDEMAYRGAAGEYVVLINTSGAPLNLAGWQLGDAAHPGDAEALAPLPPDATMPPGGAFVVARSGAGFAAAYGVPPDAQFDPTDATAPVLPSAGPFALDDTGDELILLAPDGTLADALCYGDGDCAALGLRGVIVAPAGDALQRVPGLRWAEVSEVRERWLVGPASPLAALAWPAPAPHAPVPLANGLMAFWGNLDAPSTYTPGGARPPLALAAFAAAQGLDFVAPADPLPHPLPAAAPVTLLPAWRWEDDSDSAVIFAPTYPDAAAWPAGLGDRWALFPYLRTQTAPLLWRSGDPPTLRDTPGLAAAVASLAGAPDAAALVALWRAAGGPLIPATSNGYTGLASTSNAPADLIAALSARRGWFASAPGLWLALAAEPAQGGAPTWMGSTLAPANTVRFTVYAGDLGGAPLLLTLWRDDAAVATVNLAGGAPWVQEVLAPPGAFFYATAARADGAWAVSAPLAVAAPAPEAVQVQIAAVLPHPTQDWNHDGASDEGDEFVTLRNPGAQPVALAGWQLFDARTAAQGLNRFTLRAAHVIPAQGTLTIWRGESGIVLNDTADSLMLFLPGGGLADEVHWQDAAPDQTFVRAPDGGWAAPPGAADAAAPAAVSSAAVQSASSANSAPAAAPALAASAAVVAPAAIAAAPGAVAASVESARARGIAVDALVRGAVILPPGLLHSVIYIAQAGAAGDACARGLRIYLPDGDFPPLAVGDALVARGRLESFRGERELRVARAADLQPGAGDAAVAPVPITAAQVSEAFEGCLVRFSGRVLAADGDSLYLADLAQPAAPPVRVVVARSLGWPRPAARPGTLWQVTGVVSQMARAAPWNGGYRVLVRWPADLAPLP